MARPAGLEPATPGLEGRCSIQLSYGRTRLDTTTYGKENLAATFYGNFSRTIVTKEKAQI